MILKSVQTNIFQNSEFKDLLGAYMNNDSHWDKSPLQIRKYSSECRREYSHRVITPRKGQSIFRLFLVQKFLSWWCMIGNRGGGKIYYLCIQKKKWLFRPCNFSEYFKQCTEPPLPLQILSTQLWNCTTPFSIMRTYSIRALAPPW